MKLRKYIDEAKKVNKPIGADSSFYFKEFTKLIKSKVEKEYFDYIAEKALGCYRKKGIGKIDQYEINNTRKDRRPKDTQVAIHNLVDELLYGKFGWKPRSEGVFVWYDVDKIDKGSSYTYIFLPIGNYKIVYSPNIHDLYIQLNSRFDTYLKIVRFRNDFMDARDREPTQEEYEKTKFYKTMKEEMVDLIDSYKEVNSVRKLESITGKYTELIYKCDNYILVNQKFFYEYINHTKMKKG